MLSWLHIKAMHGTGKKYFNKNGTRFRPLYALLIICAVTGIGVYLQTSSHALSNYASLEAENGTLSGVTPKQDSTASDGNYAQFSNAPGCTSDICYPANIFTGAGPVTTPISANPVIDPNSAHYVSELESFTQANYGAADVIGPISPTTEWGITYYYSNASDPTYNVTFAHTNDWFGGTNPFNVKVATKTGSGSCNPLHIPNTATVPGGFVQASDFYTGNESQPDSSMFIIDQTKPGLICFLWQASKQTGTWTASAGGVFDAGGDGTTPLAGIGVGSGMTTNAILEGEIQAGVINHAMNFAAGSLNSTSFRYPASKSDGHGGGDLEEGMRFQLNPGFNCASMPTRFENIVCVALQKYGIYDGDSGGGGLGPFFQTDNFNDTGRSPWTTPGEPLNANGVYCLAGACGSGNPLKDIPISQFRLLANWNGS